ncbi:kinase-like protein [Biscogniauxia sp. FL1348]|nr:kinase-like protein [Biscogniauxia sp. FL1348]
MATPQESTTTDSLDEYDPSLYQQDEPRMQKYASIPIMDDVEFLEDYKPGGLCPIDIGDILDNRFEVVHKLGYGGIATVWLCYDTEGEIWRAIKINAAEKSTEDCSDIKAIRAIVSAEKLGHRKDNHVVMPLQTFWTTSPNGRHLCSVLPLLGPRLSDWRGELGKDGDRVNNICYQIVEGLNFIHSKGISHGDFRPQNILMKLESIDRLEREEMEKLIGPPITDDVWTQDGERSENAPSEVVIPLPWQRFKQFVTDEIAIVDFGEAFESANPPERLGIPSEYAAPEIIFHGKPSSASDIWSLGCTLLEVRLGSRLPGGLNAVIRRMERYLGPVPYPFRPVAEKMVYERKLEEHALWGSDPDSKPTPPQTPPDSEDAVLEPISGPLDVPINKPEEREEEVGQQYSTPLQKKIGSKQMTIEVQLPPNAPPGAQGEKVLALYNLPSDEVVQLADVLGNMFQYDPEKRIKASDVLKHEWYKGKQTISEDTDGDDADESSDERAMSRQVYWIAMALGVLVFLYVFLTIALGKWSSAGPFGVPGTVFDDLETRQVLVLSYN